MAKAVIGLDIGTCGVRAVQLGHAKDGSLSIERAASIDLPRGAMRHGAVVEADAVTAALKKLWRQGKFSSRKVAFGITNSVVMTRMVDLPWMPPADFKAALRYQVGDVLPVDLATVELDYHPMAEMPIIDERGNEIDMSRVLLVSANSNLITDLANAIRKAKLEPVGADCNAFALLRAACQGRLPEPGNLDALVDLGADQLTVVIHSGGQPRFVRTVANLGGETATTTLADRIAVSLDEAEALKRSTGLNGPAPVTAPLVESSVFGGVATSESPVINPKVAAAIEVLNPWATTLIGEVRNSLEYFRASDPTQSVGSMTLSGSTVLLPGLAERLATQFRIPVRMVDPTLNLPVGKALARNRPTDARYVIAAGLAMGVNA